MNPQDNGMGALLELLKGNLQTTQEGQQTAQDGAKSFAQMLKDRRAFVQSAENGVGDQVHNDVQNGVNGVPISPAGAVSSMLGYHTDNANKTAEEVQGLNTLNSQALGYGAQSNDLLKSILGFQNSNLDRGIQQHAQAREDFSSGFDPNGGSTGVVNPFKELADLKSQNGSDLIDPNLPMPEKLALIKKIKDAGGVRNYKIQNQTPLNPDDAASVQATNDTLKTVNLIQDRIQNSPALQKFLGNPIFGQGLIKGLQDKNAGNLIDKVLSPQDQEALAAIVKLNAKGDIATAGGGRVSSYALQAFGPTGVSGSKSAQSNKVLLDTMKKNIIHDANTYATTHGYSSVHDLPGVDFYKNSNEMLHVQGPDGQKGYVPSKNFDSKKYQIVQ